MSFTSQGPNSSPDPLATSQLAACSPKSSDRRSSSPRKPLGIATGNAQSHEVILTTPCSRKANGKSTSKNSELEKTEASPWRIRITVQAEQNDRTQGAKIPQCSPSKAFTEKTFTTMVPLKDSDEASPVRRKIKRTPRKRRSSPALRRKASGDRIGITPMLDSEPSVKDEIVVPNSTPKRGRGRPRKIMLSPKSTPQKQTKKDVDPKSCPKTSESDHIRHLPDLDTQDHSNRPSHGEQDAFAFDNEHHEFDSVLESEGFSMVSVSSLPSAQAISEDMGDSRLPSPSNGSSPFTSHQHETPSLCPSSPRPPPPPKPIISSEYPREMDRSASGTPRLARVVRAGIALQGVLSPANQRRSPQPPSSRANPSPPAAAASPKERLDDLFSGFGPGTRRELRAGLRLGEELAKRQNLVNKLASRNEHTDEDVFAPGTEVVYPNLPKENIIGGYSLKVPGSERTKSPTFFNSQLPSPARSEVDADDDRMSWKFDTLQHHVAPLQSSKNASTYTDPTSVPPSPLNHTMMEREAEWRRERETVSKQIQEANPSQVIVIDSDDENVEGSESPAEVDPGDDGDIWLEEALRSRTAQSTSEMLPIFCQTEAPKPRRSQLPSPWMQKNRRVVQEKKSADDSDLFWEPKRTNQACEASSIHVQGIVLNSDTFKAPTPTQANEQAENQISNKDEENLEKEINGNSIDFTNHSDQEQEEEDPLTDNEDLESHLLSQQSMQNDITGPLDEGTQLDANVDETSSSIFEEEVPEPQTPLPPTPSTKSKTPKHVRFSEETTRPPLSNEIASETAPLPPAPSSWFSRVTSLLPTWRTTAPTAIPLPSHPKQKTIHLSKIDQGPLPIFMPWTQSHWWALINITRQSQHNPASLFSSTSQDKPPPSANSYLGTTVTVNKWSKKITKQDCAVVSRFLDVLGERGTLRGIEAAALKGGKKKQQWGRVPGQMIDLDVVVSAVVSQWACDVQDGICRIGWGDGTGLKQGSETEEVWTKADLPVDGPRVVYVL